LFIGCSPLIYRRIGRLNVLAMIAMACGSTRPIK
jgi:hypothetical protein